MSRTDMLKAWLGIALGLAAAIGGGVRSAAANGPGTPAHMDTCDQYPDTSAQRARLPGPFHGDWNVTTGDGTTIAINFRQLTGGLRNAVTGTVTPHTLKIVNGYAANKTSLHLTVSVSGQKGDVVLTLAPNGKSFTGSGQLADGTAITWIGRQVSSGAIGAAPPQMQQTLAPSRTRRTYAAPQQTASTDEDMSVQQTEQTDTPPQQTRRSRTPPQQSESSDDDMSAQQTEQTLPNRTRQAYAPPQQSESTDDDTAPQQAQQTESTDDMPPPQTQQAYPSPPQPAQSPPVRSQSADSFHGNWSVSASDGTTFAINFRKGKSSLGKKLLHEITGGAQNNNVTGTVTPAVLKIVNGSVMDKIYLHLTVSMSGQKGDVMLTLAPDGNSFTGAGQLADGTAIAWTGQRVSSTAQTQATDASRPRNKIDRLRKEISQNDQPT